jgi:uncharacterized protein YgiM (DUF1202 family)
MSFLILHEEIMKHKRTKELGTRQMKKLYLLLLVLPALACFTGNKIQAMNVLPTIVTMPIPFKSAVIDNSPTPAHMRVTCTVTVKSLNVRSGPESNVVGWLSSGNLVSILEDPPRGDWMHIQAGNVTGWIYSKYCTRKK